MSFHNPYCACFHFISSSAYLRRKSSQIKRSLFYYFLNFTGGARYFDEGVFPNGDGLDTPLGHPLLDNDVISEFGFNKFPSAQDISDTVFNISNRDDGNKGRVPHLFMTFGQFMDHDFAYVIHPSSTSSGCRRRYLIKMYLIMVCVRASKS